MPGTVSTLLEWLAGDSLPVHRATSRHLSAIRPQFAYSSPINPKTGQRVPGLPIGRCGMTGKGVLYFSDPFMLYDEEIINSLNSFVLGEIGEGKSAEVKFETYLAAMFGYRTLVTDLRGEYTPLASVIEGSKILRFGGVAEMYLNPLDPFMDLETKKNLVANLAITAMAGDRTSLTPREDGVLMEAIIDVLSDVGDAVPTLPQLVNKLGSPSERMAERLRKPVPEITDYAYDMFLGLRRLTETDLVGMFHKETTPGLFDNTPLLIMNCENLTDEKAVLMVTVINFLTYGMLEKAGGRRFHRIIHDESWKLSQYPAFAASVQQAFKLGRGAGVANRMVMHHEQTLSRSSSADVIQDLVSDTRMFIIFRQDEAEIKKSAPLIGLTPAEVKLATLLPRYTALWKVGDLPAIPVRHNMYPEFLPVVTTDHRAKGQEVPASHLR